MPSSAAVPARTKRVVLTLVALVAFTAGSVAVMTPPAEAIVGGQVASEDYPFMAAFLDDGSQICGASLVAPQWVLSAAHCVGELDPSHYSFRIGGVRDLAGEGGETIQADQVIVHPDYEGEGFDVSLFHLERASNFAPISLANPETQKTFWEPDDIARVIGYGGQVFLMPSIDEQLREVDVPVVSDEDCETTVFQGIDEATEVCAGELHGTEDSCQGDSGGPLMVRGDQNQWLQMGAVSWGNGCAVPTQYGVYARVGDTTLYNWIQQTITNTEPPPPPPPPPPTETVTVEPQGHIMGFLPAFGLTGITETEFALTCSTELATQGADGYVWALPPELAVDGAIAKLTGDSSFFYDLDITFWDSGCGFIDGSSTGDIDEQMAVPDGTAYVIAQNFFGADVLVDLTVTVPDTETTLAITSDTTEARYKEELTFSARLTDAADEPVTGQTVRFALIDADGETVQIAPGSATDEDGVSTTTTRLAVPAGDYTVEAVFGGEPSGLEEARATAPFVALPGATEVSVAPSGVGANKDVSATLIEVATGTGIRDRTVEFFADCASIGTGATGGDGTTTISVPPRYRAATTVFSAVFEGDTGAQRFYEGSRAGPDC